MGYIFNLSNYGIIVVIAVLLASVSTASPQHTKNKQVVRQYKMVRDSLVEVPYQKIPNVPYDTVRVIANWIKLKSGMTENQVATLLGRPAIYQCDFVNALNYWWYGKRAVVFNAVSGKVSGWDR